MAVTQQQVNDALGNAASNGFTFDDWSEEDIALDLIAYDAFVDIPGAEEVDVAELVPLIRAWRAHAR